MSSTHREIADTSMDLLQLNIEAEQMLKQHDTLMAHARTQNLAPEQLAQLRAAHGFHAGILLERRDVLLAKQADLLARFRPTDTKPQKRSSQ